MEPGQAIHVFPEQATSMISRFWRAGKVPMLLGSPASGKSSIIKQLAEEFNLEVIDLRLAQCDPTDLLGFPSINKDGSKAGYVPMDTFPIEGDPLPNGRDGWVLFLDEMNSANHDVQKAAYKLVLDKQVGRFNLHPKVVCCAAGNLETDNAIVEEMSTALSSRMTHLELKVSPKQWNVWAQQNDIHHYITSYINFAPQQLYKFQPELEERTYASPRTWHFLSDIMKHVDIDDPDFLPMASGTISEGVAREFISYTQIYKDLPTIQAIRKNPLTTPVPDDPGTLWALTGSIAHHAEDSNMPELMEYVGRIPLEFQVTCLREMCRRQVNMLDNPEIQQWSIDNAADLF